MIETALCQNSMLSQMLLRTPSIGASTPLTPTSCVCDCALNVYERGHKRVWESDKHPTHLHTLCRDYNKKNPISHTNTSHYFMWNFWWTQNTIRGMQFQKGDWVRLGVQSNILQGFTWVWFAKYITLISVMWYMHHKYITIWIICIIHAYVHTYNHA